MKPIILSGGSGTRLWPASKPLKPKQFLKLVNDNYNLFQDTCTRLEELGCDSPIVVCNEKTKNLVTQSLQEINVNNAHIILEPTARDTAPAIAVAALKAIENGDDPVLLVLPSDHVINHKDKFKSAVTRAEKLALDGNLVTFGITPTEPNTGFGYIQVGTSIEPEAYKVQSFKEKPNKSTAKHMIKQGGHLWNGGMFAFKASVFLKELKTHAPDIFKAAKFALDKSKSNHEYTLLNKNEFQKVRKTSIDYAVMEKTKNAAVVELNTQWYDVGTWRSLYEYSEKDSNGNVKKGNANIITIDSKNNLVYSTARDISIVLGNVEGLFVVQADNDILVANSEANMRKIVAEVKKSPPNIKFVKVSEAPNQGKQIVFVNAKSNTMLCAIAAYTNTIAEQLRNFGYDVKEVGVNQLDDGQPPICAPVLG